MYRILRYDVERTASGPWTVQLQEEEEDNGKAAVHLCVIIYQVSMKKTKNGKAAAYLWVSSIINREIDMRN